MATLLSIEGIHKTFEAGTVNENHVLKGLDLQVEEGDFISVIGGNGAGKSTLMNILAGNLVVDEGDILLEGNSIKNTSVRKRAKDIARVFQDPKMGTASRLTIEENMAIAQRRGKSRGLSWGVREKDRELFREALKELNIGLENRLKVDTQYLSGGQRQRVAIARALANNPAIIMADEPTGNLDSKSTIDVMNIFRGLHDEGRTILLVTHEPDIATYASRNVVLKDGIIVEDSINSNMTPIKEVPNV